VPSGTPPEPFCSSTPPPNRYLIKSARIVPLGAFPEAVAIRLESRCTRATHPCRRGAPRGGDSRRGEPGSQSAAGGSQPRTTQRLARCSKARSRALAPRPRRPHRLPAPPPTTPAPPHPAARTLCPPTLRRAHRNPLLEGAPAPWPNSTRIRARIPVRIAVPTRRPQPSPRGLPRLVSGGRLPQQKPRFTALLLETVAPDRVAVPVGGARGRTPFLIPPLHHARYRARERVTDRPSEIR
jgi:hypothetical protein